MARSDCRVVTRRRRGGALTAAAVVAAAWLVSGAMLANPARAANSATTRVPDVRGLDVVVAYTRLHRAHLKVSSTNHFVIENATEGPPVVARMHPAPGRRVTQGANVTIRVACGCSVSSLGLPTGRLPAYRVPGFVGQDGPVASRWAKGKLVAVRFQLSDLRRADAPSLLANYVITRQTPVAGKHISFVTTATGNGLRVTPVVLWTRRRRGALDPAAEITGGRLPYEPRGVNRADGLTIPILAVAAVGLILVAPLHRRRARRADVDDV